MIAFFRSAFVAAVFAAVGVLGGVTGCLALLGMGIVALAVLHDRRDLKHGESLEPWQFMAWAGCVSLYACFVLALAPFAELAAVVVALLALSPLFGTMILLVSRALSSLANRDS